MRDSLEKQLGEFLRKQRGEQTFVQFSRKAGLPGFRLRRLERAEQSIILGKLEQIMKRLKCWLRDIFEINSGTALLQSSWLYSKSVRMPASLKVKVAGGRARSRMNGRELRMVSKAESEAGGFHWGQGRHHDIPLAFVRQDNFCVFAFYFQRIDPPSRKATARQAADHTDYLDCSWGGGEELRQELHCRSSSMVRLARRPRGA